MKEEFQKYIDYHRHKGGTGKLYDFELIDYKTGFLKLKAFFNSNTLSLLIAPSINKLLSAQDASIYLRYVWPKFFIIIGAISLISWILIFH